MRACYMLHVSLICTPKRACAAVFRQKPVRTVDSPQSWSVVRVGVFQSENFGAPARHPDSERATLCPSLLADVFPVLPVERGGCIPVSSGRLRETQEPRGGLRRGSADNVKIHVRDAVAITRASSYNAETTKHPNYNLSSLLLNLDA
ncbi:hypothetical protein BV20DRAFT_397563 [Pilatotrama ljubarskyi]|nr:hypothetical protein BV20DRAFT_397563 [Pilatotrama ljubarskyi]